MVWAAVALAKDDTTVAPLAYWLDADRHILWRAVAVEAQRRVADPARLAEVEPLGVDEHLWRPGRFGAGREVTCLVDLSRDGHSQIRSQLLDLVLGRSGPAYGGWRTRSAAAFSSSSSAPRAEG